jgi:hypothetical protein
MLRFIVLSVVKLSIIMLGVITQYSIVMVSFVNEFCHPECHYVVYH